MPSSYCIFHLILSMSLASSAIASPEIDQIKKYLASPTTERARLKTLAASKVALTKEDVVTIAGLLFKDRVKELDKDRRREFDDKLLKLGGKTLKYEYRKLGDKPAGGHSLYISMHGGGGAPARVNDGQWKNQIKLYTPKEGIYVAPRAPTDTWDLWHQSHIDTMFDRLIENFIIHEGINPNKVYIMGYSAGGDGVYQLAPRMADRWAAAAMMAGHPGDAQTYNLRNLPYILQCGGKDAAYKRNLLCAEWGEKLDKLEKEDPGGYRHKAIVYPKYGHWMNLECKQAVPWMAAYTRNPWPIKLNWYQDNVTHRRFFWLANKQPKANQLITAEVKGQTITLTLPNLESSAKGQKPKEPDFAPLPSITLRLSDQLVDLDKEITVVNEAGKTLYQGKVKRSLLAIQSSLEERLDLTSVASALLDLEL